MFETLTNTRKMDLSFAKFFSRLFAKQEMRIPIVGLDAASKTTIPSIGMFPF